MSLCTAPRHRILFAETLSKARTTHWILPVGAAAILAGCGATGVAGDVPQAIDLGGEVAAAGLQAGADGAGGGADTNVDRSAGEAKSGETNLNGSEPPKTLPTPAQVSPERRSIAAAAIAEYASKVGITVTDLRVSTEAATSSDADVKANARGRWVRLAMLVSRVKGTWKVVKASEIPTGTRP